MSSDPLARIHAFRAVTVNYRSKESTSRLARNLFSVNGCEELIIVNHDPGESFDDLGKDWPVRVINEANNGYGAGLNRGLREMNGWKGMVLLCNPDVIILNPDVIREAVDYLAEHPEVACLLPALYDSNSVCRMSCRQFYTWKTIAMSRMTDRQRVYDMMPGHFYLDKDRNKSFEVDWGSGAAMLVRAQLFPGTISFDERYFMYFEDVDLCAQIWKSGFKVVYYPYLKLCHEESGMSHSRLKFLGMHLASAFRFVLKHKGFPSREQMLKVEGQKSEVRNGRKL
ncbi:MAG: glycosyltransferase [Kiritimatiellae bacterium]|nr:glycosyltransferase [Kiritimatiellia bacterium]MDD5521709.1 glycosyltransferase [Kiritimatiellia bacterium]